MGVSFIRTVTSPSVDDDLTDLATVKDELNLNADDVGDDAWLQRAISQVSAVCANYCNRQFLPEGVTETQYIQQDAYPSQTPGGIAPLQLSRWPIIKILSVVQNYPIGTDIPFVEGTDFSVDYEKGQLTRLSPFTGIATAWGAVTTVIKYSAGYGALVSENFTVPISPGPYTRTVSKAAAFSYDAGVTYASGTPLVAVGGSPTVGQYAIDAATGVYTFAAADAGAAIIIGYAYGDIPYDLIDVVLRTVTQRYKQRERDPMLMSEDIPGVGNRRWWVETGGKQGGALPPEITGILDNYRVPVIG